MKAITEVTKQLLAEHSTDKRLAVDVTPDGKSFVISVLPYASRRDMEWLDRFPEHIRLTQENARQVPITDVSVAIILQSWPRTQLVLTDEARGVLAYTNARFIKYDQLAERYARFKEEGVIPPVEMLEHPDHTLADYQRLAYANAYGNEGYALFMEQGTGKTPIIVNRICNEANVAWEKQVAAGVEAPVMYKAIILCPNNVRSNWLAEFEKFATIGGNVNILRGDKLGRTRVFLETFIPDEDCRYAVLICGYDTFAASSDLILSVEWDLACCDEAHAFKSHYTKRSRLVHQLRDCSKQRIALTGTPVTNTIYDLYTQFEFLGEGFSGFSTTQAFRSFYGNPDVESGVEVPMNLPFLQERMARMSFSITKREALPYLPDKVYDLCEVEITGEQAEAYKKLATQLAIELEADLEKGDRPKSLIIQNVLTKLLRLAQVTSGHIRWDAVYDDDGSELYPKSLEYFDPNPKLDELVRILKEKGPNEKTIVWSCFVPDIVAIRERLAAEGIKAVTYFGGDSEKEREANSLAFNHDREVKVMIANPAAGSTGVNWLGYPPGQEDAYETNCDHAIYFAKNWSYAQRAQSEDRCHRRGTRGPVRITDLIVAGTIDETIHRRVTMKRDTALAIGDIRAILKQLIG